MQEVAGDREAVVVVLRRARQVLVIQRGPEAIFPGYWAPLSGRIEEGESQEQAVVQEVKEEVGIHATPVAKVWQAKATMVNSDSTGG
jgi:8-oxo-dGTP diphosphatase